LIEHRGGGGVGVLADGWVCGRDWIWWRCWRDRLSVGDWGRGQFQAGRQPQRQQFLRRLTGLLAGGKPLRRVVHVQGLVGAVAVVLGHPRVHRGLGSQYIVKGFGVVEEFAAEAAVEPLDFPGGGGTGGFGEPVGDAVVPADPVEEHFPALAESIGELFPVIRQHFLGHPVAAQCLSEGQAHRPPGRAHHNRGYHTEPGMVIDPGDDLALAAIGQHQAPDDVDLPQRHRRLAFPAPILTALTPSATGLDQAVAAQDPVHR
jgi:hypothetical protein